MELTARDTYLLGRLDTIIDRQSELRLLLQQLLILVERSQASPIRTEGSNAREKKSSIGLFNRIQNIPLMWQWIIGGIVSCGVSRAISVYLTNGGQPLELIKLLLGLFV